LIGLFDPLNINYEGHKNSLVTLCNLQNSRFILWDLREEKQLSQYIDGSPVFAPKHSLVTSAKDGQIMFWDTSTGEQIETEEPINGDNVIFSPDGRYFAVSSLSPFTMVTLWNTTELKQIGKPIFGQVSTDYHNFSQPLFGIGPDEKIMVVQSIAGHTLWDITTGKLIGNPIPNVDSNSVFLSPESRFLVFGQYYSGSNTVLDLQTLERRSTPAGRPVLFSPDEKWLVVRSDYGNGDWFWDVENGIQVGPPIRSQTGQSISISTFDQPYIRKNFYNYNYNRLIFSPNQYENFAILDDDGSVTLWGTNAPPSMPGTEKTIDDSPTSVVTTTLSPDGSMLAISTPDKLGLYQSVEGGSFTLMKYFDNHHIRRVDGVAISPDGKTILSYNNSEASLSLLDTESKSSVEGSKTIDDAADMYFFSPDDGRVFSGLRGIFA